MPPPGAPKACSDASQSCQYLVDLALLICWQIWDTELGKKCSLWGAEKMPHDNVLKGQRAADKDEIATFKKNGR
ncbi:hypothetical protein CEXT_711311 [Caerostris extrusa]|uniref:Uncharacterized protein n=1 Tax=Caerostris extrusa TaxID=172846 RepID=A0AAV4Y4Y3_CAEEX|nr:hypothetical protein CEXT_711311 [Caerostris extrusa]